MHNHLYSENLNLCKYPCIFLSTIEIEKDVFILPKLLSLRVMKNHENSFSELILVSD